MASGDGGRANWKDPELYKLFIDLCLKESTENGKNGGSLKKESWDRILIALNKEKGLNLTQKQVKNQWDFLKSKYGEWSKIVSKTGNGYDPVTNTVNWSTEEWSEYIQANTNAKQFRYTGLQYSNELKALFDGVRATGRFSWGPSKEGFPTDGTQSQSPTYINLDIGSLETPSSPNGDVEKHGNKRQKKNKSSDDLDKQLLEALHTLQSSDGPTLEECNRILDEMQLFDMSALDGTLISAVVPRDQQIPYRGRGRGECYQNVLAICDFDMLFTFVWAGWEGVAHDSRVLRETMSDPANNFPILPPAYTHTRRFMAPYRNVRYWLADFQNGRRPRNKEERFNLAHARLRNVIERAFGVLKSRFPILKRMSSYPFAVQRNMVIACITMHNFIRRTCISDQFLDKFNDPNASYDNAQHHVDNFEVGGGSTQADQIFMLTLREQIATQLNAINYS
ncbi:hypothetical protein RHSIM_Rhsim05G0210200 [Rhododendron simsii]|uniref:Myb/SANT-like domain-containing protein n=1 Tax=Rhododendron simsii TaxID=118357 RepID=A0A834GWQ7_RHOSS|nr:hypothetical protein RHSIM_Rhsim05G0210200 [Rhododendron simsii]